MTENLNRDKFVHNLLGDNRNSCFVTFSTEKITTHDKENHFVIPCVEAQTVLHCLVPCLPCPLTLGCDINVLESLTEQKKNAFDKNIKLE